MTSLIHVVASRDAIQPSGRRALLVRCGDFKDGDVRHAFMGQNGLGNVLGVDLGACSVVLDCRAV